MIMLWLLTLTTAYLLGSIPFGYLLVRFLRKEDVRSTGSGNIGATNVARTGGTTLGLLTLLLDALKGYLAVLLAMHLAPNTANGPSTLAVAAAVAAVIGHVFPIWLRFRGGKGIATALGVFIALAPLVALSSVGVFALIVATTRLVSLGSILAAVSIPFLALLLVPHRSNALLIGLSFISLLSIVKHHANIVRLLHGKESRFGGSKNSDSTDKKNPDSNDKKVNA
jgi:glycerol-3-phosphate acyltransferase PlsY